MTPRVCDLASFQDDMLDRTFSQAMTEGEAGMTGPDYDYICVSCSASVTAP
jgi:hypothetical protein